MRKKGKMQLITKLRDWITKPNQVQNFLSFLWIFHTHKNKWKIIAIENATNSIEGDSFAKSDQSINAVKRWDAAAPSHQLDKIQSTFTQNLISTLILSYHHHIFLPNGLFPSGVPTQNLHAFTILRTRATCPACRIPLPVITLHILPVFYICVAPCSSHLTTLQC